GALLPAPRGGERSRKAESDGWLAGFLGGWAGLAEGRGRTAVLAGAGVLVVVCGLLAARVGVDNSLKRNFGAWDEVRLGDARLNEHFAGTNTLVLLVEGAQDGALEEPAILRAIDRLERHLASRPGVGPAPSYVDLGPRMHGAMPAARRDAGPLPPPRPMTTQSLFLNSLSGGGEQMDPLLDPTPRIAKVRVLVRDDSTR